MKNTPTPYQARVLRLLADGFSFEVSYSDPRKLRGALMMRVPPRASGSDVDYKRLREELGSARENVPAATVKAMIRKRHLEVVEESKDYLPNPIYHLTPRAHWLDWVRQRAEAHHFQSPEYKKPDWTEQQMLDLLKKRYSPPRYAYFRQFALGTGATAPRRIDAFVMSVWPSDGFARMAFEVKVSRSDFLRELKDERKRKRAATYSNEFYFVAPAGMIAHGELPEGTGLLEARLDPRGKPYLRMAVRPKTARAPDLPPSIVAAIMRRVDRMVEYDDVLRHRAKAVVNVYFPLKRLLEEDAPAERFKSVVKSWFAPGRGGLDDDKVAAYSERYNLLHADDQIKDAADES